MMHRLQFAARSLVISLALCSPAASGGAQPGNSAPDSAPRVPPEAAPETAPEGATLAAARARETYRACSTFSARIQLLTRAVREGSDSPVDTETYFTLFAFDRAGRIRAEARDEINGIDGDRCWGALPDSREWMEAPLPPPGTRAEWISLQHWIPFVGLGLWKCIIGAPEAHPFLVTDLHRITDVRACEYDGRPAVEVIGVSPHPWRLAEPPVATSMTFDRERAVLREVAWESTVLQRQQDGYRENDGEKIAPLKQAWYVLRLADQKLDQPIDAAEFSPPAGFTRVPLLSGPRGYSLRFVGKTVPGVGRGHETPDLNLAMFKDKVWILYVGLMGDDLEQEPGILSMEWLHDTLSPRGLHVLSVGNHMGPTDMTRARAWARAHDLQHRTIAGEDGRKFGFSPQQYWPVILLADSDAMVHAAFTGYAPVFSLALREGATRLLEGRPVFTAEELQAIRDRAGE